MTEITSIRVEYKHVDGYHVFFSERLPGLYVAHTDPERAFNDVPKVIEKLVRLNAGVACEVRVETSFADFVRTHAVRRPKSGRAPAKAARTARAALAASPVAYTAHRYAVYACG